MCGRSGFSCLSRATSVCMNLLNSVSFFRPPAELVFPVDGCECRGQHLLACAREGEHALLGLAPSFLAAFAAACLPGVTTMAKLAGRGWKRVRAQARG